MARLVIRPLSPIHGTGFFSMEALPPDKVRGYEYVQVGRYHNYHCTRERWRWPGFDLEDKPEPAYVFDAFSPNLDKEFWHVGHLRNLAVASFLRRSHRNSSFVALLGASKGVRKQGLAEWGYWTEFLDYHPELYYDVLLPIDAIQTRYPTDEEIAADVVKPESERKDLVYDSTGRLPEVWDGPNGLVLVKRLDGSPLYAYHDIVFSQLAHPTHYVTGREQQHHFEQLGLGKKHLPLGIVLGPDGKKLKSRENTELTAAEAMKLVEAGLDRDEQGQHKTSDPKKLAWNVLCWNFLHVGRVQDVRFEPEKWTQPEAPGLYITYTWARIVRALKGLYPPLSPEQPIDIELVGFADQNDYWHRQAAERFDSASLANYTHDLARKIGTAYHTEPIREGRRAFQGSLGFANQILGKCMTTLGMFRLDQV